MQISFGQEYLSPMSLLAKDHYLPSGAPKRETLLFETDGWLAVSLEGFAQQNVARPIEHLIKELVQNSLDAILSTGGSVFLDILQQENGKCIVKCLDDGEGIVDMYNLRTVFWTSKQDSRFKRGRMGRGFKELLSLCDRCVVRSGDVQAVFSIGEDGNRKFSIIKQSGRCEGTQIEMTLPEEIFSLKSRVESYFSSFIPPFGVSVSVCGNLLKHRPAEVQIKGTLTSEEFKNGRWIKPRAKTDLDLVKCFSGESGVIYEMGIPVCSAEWDIPYHVNVLQRVPMNPNRDAVMSGYVSQIHRACLPHVLDIIPSDKVRGAWVGEAASKIRDGELQKKILRKAFGDHLARSVPDFGKFSHDADAQENSGVLILDTKQLTGGFRDLARKHVPTSAEVSRVAQELKRRSASDNGVSGDVAKSHYRQLMIKRGDQKVRRVCDFYKWMADGILTILFPTKNLRCKVNVADFQGSAEATWTDNFQTLTLALELDRIWDDPFHHENFALIVHETAHEIAAHHGRSFSTAMESTAGAACRFLIQNRHNIPVWQA